MNNSMASTMRRRASSTVRPCVWQPRTPRTEATHHPDSSRSGELCAERALAALAALGWAADRAERVAYCIRVHGFSRGIVPDTFTDANDIEVIVEGRLGRDGVFHATEVFAKCGSRYEAELDKAAKA